MARLNGLTKAAKLASGRSQKCETCILRKKRKCDMEVIRVCHDIFVEGYKKGAHFPAKKEKEITERIAKPVYKISDADDACKDSDFLFEALKLIIDRTSETPESKKKMLEHITQIPSKMGIYELVKQEIE